MAEPKKKKHGEKRKKRMQRELSKIVKDYIAKAGKRKA